MMPRNLTSGLDRRTEAEKDRDETAFGIGKVLLIVICFGIVGAFDQQDAEHQEIQPPARSTNPVEQLNKANHEHL